MKKYFTSVLIFLTVHAWGQDINLDTVDLVHSQHIGRYMQNKITHKKQKIEWYPDVEAYRDCGNKAQKLKKIPAEFAFDNHNCHCIEDIQLALVAPFSNIQFEFDSPVLKTSAYPVLDNTAADLKSTGVTVELDGFASSEGTATHNMRLSKDRANAVKTYLVNSGVEAKKLKIKPYGETHPIADNSTEDGRVSNRRVEIKKK